jgi:type I restriction enzyme, S subunit
MSEHAPAAWKELPFGGLCARIVNGGTPATDNVRFWGGHIPWVTGADFTPKGIGEIRRYISEAGVRSSATSVVKAGNLLVVTRTGVGKIAIAPFDIAISQDITGVYLDETQVDTRFAFHLLSREIEELKKLNQGTSINGIVRSDLERHRVSLPADTSQQRRIAAVLSRVDSAIEASEALIEKHQHIKAGLVHDLFARGVLPPGQLRPPPEVEPGLYRQLRGRSVPATWRETELQDIAQVSRGKFTHRPRNDPKFLGGPFPFIQTGDIAAAAGGFLSHYSQTLSDKGAAVSSRFPAGTIAVTIAANIADTAILSIPMFFPDSVVGVIVGTEADIRFVELSIRLSKPRLEAMAPQSAQKNINLKDLRPLRLMLPPLEEQQAISSRYEAAHRPIAVLQATLAKLRARKLGLMQDLLTGKVAVKVPEPAFAA